jgi:hypothetical protein
MGGLEVPKREAQSHGDLVNVTFVDDDGALLLAQMRRDGAKLIGSGLLIAALIEEIERAEFAHAK